MLLRAPSRHAAAGLALLGLACAGSPGGPGGVEERRAPLVEAVAARSGALPIEETTPGVVRARNQVAIRPEVSGRIVAVPVAIGQAVERGRLLVRLDDAELRDRLRQSEADVRLAEAGAEAARARVAELAARVSRSRELAAERLISAQEMESLEAQLDALRASAAEEAARVEQRRAAAEERRSALAKTEVRAPVAGRLGGRRAEVGMQVDPGDVLFVVGDPDELIVEVNLTEKMLATVEPGQPVLIETGSASGEPVRAELTRISPFLEAESFTTVGEIDVDNRAGSLRPGMFVDVRILVGESRRATLVPVSALWEDPASGRRGLFVIAQGAGLDAPAAAPPAEAGEPRAVDFRPVTVLAEGRGAAGVEGVEEGAWVVTVGQQLLAADLQTAALAAAAAAGDGGGAAPSAPTARVRPVTWDHVLELQDLQDEDLLEGFLDKQRKVAAALGAEIPESEEVVYRVLEEAAAEAPPPGQ